MRMQANELAIATKHQAFLTGLEDLFGTLIEMGYLQCNDISFPPHEDLPLEPLRRTGFEQDAIDLISGMPHLAREVYEYESAAANGIELAPCSRAVSYLSSQGIEVGQEQPLPGVLMLTRGGRDSGTSIAYDLRGGKLIVGITGVMEAERKAESVIELEQNRICRNIRRTPVEAYFQTWIDKFRSLKWLPWHDGFGHVVLSRPTAYEDHPAHPSKIKENARLRHLSLTTTGLVPPSIDQVVDDHVAILKAEHNMFWSKRLVYETAGWGHNFDVATFRAGREDYDRSFRDAVSVERVGPRGQSIYDIQHGGTVRAWYRNMAGQYAV